MLARGEPPAQQTFSGHVEPEGERAAGRRPQGRAHPAKRPGPKSGRQSTTCSAPGPTTKPASSPSSGPKEETG